MFPQNTPSNRLLIHGKLTKHLQVIMTDQSHRAQYERLSESCEIVESRLHEGLVEILNAEICNKVKCFLILKTTFEYRYVSTRIAAMLCR